MNFPLIANAVGFVVLLLLLAQARHKQWSLAKKVLVGLAMGVVFGLALQAIYGSDNPVLKDSIQWFNIVGTGYVGKVSYTIKIKKNICGLAKSKYICGGNYRAMAVNQYDRSYDNMFILYNNEEGRYIIFS